MRVISEVNIVGELNRVAAMHASSLANYLGDAPPWVRAQQQDVAETVMQIASNQRAIVGEVGDYVMELGGIVETGLVPMEFAGYHDLSFDYLAPHMVEEFAANVAEMEEISTAVASDARAQGLVDRAIGAAKAHIDMLNEQRGS